MLKNILFLLVLGPVVSCESQLCCEEEIDYSYHASTLLRSYEGSASGQDLPREAKLQAARAAQNLFATGQVHTRAQWEIFTPPLKGNFTLIKIYQDRDIPCLEYRQTLILSQVIRKSIGIACINSQGVWTIVKELPDT